jgi:hypothetical protein
MRVEPRYWDKRKSLCALETAPNLRERRRLADLNDHIETLKRKIYEVDDQLAEKGKYHSFASIRAIVDEIKFNGKSDLSPLQHMYRLVETYPKTVNRRGKRGNTSTQLTYRVALQRIENYCRQKRIKIESFNDFDKHFFADFTQFLYTCPLDCRNKLLLFPISQMSSSYLNNMDF